MNRATFDRRWDGLSLLALAWASPSALFIATGNPEGAAAMSVFPFARKLLAPAAAPSLEPLVESPPPQVRRFLQVGGIHFGRLGLFRRFIVRLGYRGVRLLKGHGLDGCLLQLGDGLPAYSRCSLLQVLSDLGIRGCGVR